MNQQFADWLRGFVPPSGTVNRFERMRSCAGALFGLLMAGLLTHLTVGESLGAAWLIAPMGASSVLLFAVPASPLAQPWSIIGGNISAAIIGVTCGKLVSDPLIGAALAGSLAIGGMFWLRCLHPPSGAVALTAVLGGPAIHAMGYHFVLMPVAVNSILLLAAALFYNNATGRRYPHGIPAEVTSRHDTGDVLPTSRLGFSADDLDAVLKTYNEVIDISREDLQTILTQTEMLGYQRRFGAITCAAVMSRDVVSAEFGTTLDEAWALMREHHLTALPIIDRARRVIGIVTKTDFLMHADLDRHMDIGSKLAGFIRRSHRDHSEKPEVVGQIMSTNVILASVDKPVVELVPAMSDAGLHQLPVIDEERRLVGILTQSDLIAALYESSLQKV
ncbi:MAG: signal transduction protein [Herbaspirillum sp.]|nr:signal transduction protein [Herbaspirillum sp.]